MYCRYVPKQVTISTLGGVEACKAKVEPGHRAREQVKQ